MPGGCSGAGTPGGSTCASQGSWSHWRRAGAPGAGSASSPVGTSPASGAPLQWDGGVRAAPGSTRQQSPSSSVPREQGVGPPCRGQGTEVGSAAWRGKILAGAQPLGALAHTRWHGSAWLMAMPGLPGRAWSAGSPAAVAGEGLAGAWLETPLRHGPGTAVPPHRDLHGTAWHGTGLCVPSQGSECHKERCWPCQGEAITEPAPAGGQDPSLSILLPCASSLQVTCSSLLPPPSPLLPHPPPPPPGTLCSSRPHWENRDSPAFGTGVGELQMAPVPDSCPQAGRFRGSSSFCKHPLPAPGRAALFGLQTETLPGGFTPNSSCLVKTKKEPGHCLGAGRAVLHLGTTAPGIAPTAGGPRC